MKEPFNPPLKKGDEIICYHMGGETSVPPGTKGIVIEVGRDPFTPDEFIYEVKWENGSRLALLSSEDVWKKTKTRNINEN